MSKLSAEVLISGDKFSEDRKYRYKLWRVMEARDRPKTALFIMLNPSIATKEEDDPTQIRCRKFARREGSSQYFVGNLFALVSTDPRELLNERNPVGPDNDKYLSEQIEIADLTIVAWGSWKGNSREDRIKKNLRVKQILSLLEGKDLFCLGVNSDGSPKHPLYVPASTPLQRFMVRPN